MKELRAKYGNSAKGVDVTDILRKYSGGDYYKLPKDIKQYIWEHKETRHRQQDDSARQVKAAKTITMDEQTFQRLVAGVAAAQITSDGPNEKGPPTFGAGKSARDGKKG